MKWWNLRGANHADTDIALNTLQPHEGKQPSNSACHGQRLTYNLIDYVGIICTKTVCIAALEM